MEVEFKIDSSQFDSKVVICLEEKSVDALLVNLNHLLE
jgi:chemotaxis protein CheC